MKTLFQLKSLKILLTRKFCTARELSTQLGVSRLQVYRRLEALRESGVELQEKKVRERRTGPMARAFKLARGLP